MRGILGQDSVLGYCTNVHPGASLAETRANLERHTLAVKARVSPRDPMGVGLWFSAATATELLAGEKLDELAAWLDSSGLLAYTLNGFPQADFHRPVVKHDVYRPDWADEDRLRYTLDLARILARLLPEGDEGSISTLPIGWRAHLTNDTERLGQAAAQLRTAVDALARIEDETGKRIHLDLEPEPGCVLDRGRDVVDWFQERMTPLGDDDRLRRHLRVCHDVCHTAVMFEEQRQVLDRYDTEGIEVGKVQISSAPRLTLGARDPGERSAALSRLSRFREDRYLHQTVIRRSDGTTRFFEDLPGALAAVEDSDDEWRVHFHVPLFVEELDGITTTADEIWEVLGTTAARGTRHFEVETYAWDVLPDGLRAGDLALGIAREIDWLRRGVVERGEA